MDTMNEVLNQVEVNGVCLHYIAAGEGRPIVLVHGNGESHELFRVEIDQLTAAGYRVYAPDSRGHGANPPLQEYHYADMAEDIYQFICAMQLKQPAFYGHSDGGIIGLLLEIMHPGTLGILAASGVNLSPDGLDPAFLEECAQTNELSPDPLITLMLEEPQIDPQSLEKIDIPVLLTAGEYDLVLPEETRCIAEHLPRAEMVILEGEDHGSYIEDSEIMGQILIEYLDEEWQYP